jgi:hypothetical protein
MGGTALEENMLFQAQRDASSFRLFSHALQNLGRRFFRLFHGGTHQLLHLQTRLRNQHYSIFQTEKGCHSLSNNPLCSPLGMMHPNSQRETSSRSPQHNLPLAPPNTMRQNFQRPRCCLFPSHNWQCNPPSNIGPHFQKRKDYPFPLHNQLLPSMMCSYYQRQRGCHFPLQAQKCNPLSTIYPHSLCYSDFDRVPKRRILEHLFQHHQIIKGQRQVLQLNFSETLNRNPLNQDNHH